MLKIRKHGPISSTVLSSLINLPTPSSINSWWNFGSLLGLSLMMQIITGLIIAMHFSCNISTAFESVEHLMRDVNNGWLMRIIHANGASMFFICLYLHIMRGMYFSSFKFLHTWMMGVTILFLTMATAFIGYVLPWGQMSFWGATVITNLMSAIPYLGTTFVQWIWGGFSVENATLTRFFTLHFLLPFMLVAAVVIHLIFLHQSGSSNPMGVNGNADKLPFHHLHSWKDAMGIMIFMMTLFTLSLMNPFLLGDTENFIPANPLVTPLHIQPEWYFLFAYAILRSVPNKLGGVIALMFSIAILYMIPFLSSPSSSSSMFLPINKFILWTILMVITILTWIGAKPVEPPFILMGQNFTACYFILFMMWPLSTHFWTLVMNPKSS